MSACLALILLRCIANYSLCILFLLNDYYVFNSSFFFLHNLAAPQSPMQQEVPEVQLNSGELASVFQ